MGLHFTVYPPDDLAKLDQMKRVELANAIRQVLQNDPDVKQLLKAKTWDTYQALLNRP